MTWARRIPKGHLKMCHADKVVRAQTRKSVSVLHSTTLTPTSSRGSTPTRQTRAISLFLWQAERHTDILATILASILVSVSASWNAAFYAGLIHTFSIISINILFRKLIVFLALQETPLCDFSCNSYNVLVLTTNQY